MVRQLRHRQTKGAATAAMNLLPLRHISTSHEKQGDPDEGSLGMIALEALCSHGIYSFRYRNVQQISQLAARPKIPSRL